MQSIQGRIIKFIPRTEGDSANGKHWVKAGIVVEYGDEYPTKAAFSIFGETRLQQCAGLTVGVEVAVNYYPQSREYNERWYTDLQCVSVTPIVQQQVPQTGEPSSTQPQTQNPTAQQVRPQAVQTAMEEDTDLPF